MGLFEFPSGTGIFFLSIYICIFVPTIMAQTCSPTECYFDPDFLISEELNCTINPVDNSGPTCYAEWSSLSNCECTNPYTRISTKAEPFCSQGDWTYDVYCKDPCIHDVDTTVVIVHLGDDCTTGEVIDGTVPVNDSQQVCYECPQGYTEYGSSKPSCADGVWDSSIVFTCTGFPCDSSPPTGDEDMITYEPSTAPYDSGTVVMYSCPEGYQVGGSTSALCSLGNWTLEAVPPSCSPIPTGLTTIGLDPTTDDPWTTESTGGTVTMSTSTDTTTEMTTDAPTEITTPDSESTTGGSWTTESTGENVTTTDITETETTNTTANSTETTTPESESTTGSPWTTESTNENVTTSTNTTATEMTDTTGNSTESTTPDSESTTGDPWTTELANVTVTTPTNITVTEMTNTTANLTESTTPESESTTGYPWTTNETVTTSTNITATEMTNTTDNTTYATTSTTAPEETCDAPDTGNVLQISPSQSLYGEGAAVEYSCPGEYRLTGPNSAVCTSGEWVPAEVPTCELVCLPPVPYDEFLEINPFRSSYNENDTIEYSCPRGYLIDLETSEASCNSSGEWDPSDVPSCKAIPCEAQETWADVSYAPIKDSYPHGTDVTFTCPEDEIPIGPTEAVCELGDWSSDAPTCVPEAGGETVEVTYCEAPPSFEGVIVTPLQDYYGVEAEVTFSCADRAEVVNTDDNIASCQDGGKWSNYPTSCVACGRESDIGQCAGEPDHVCNHNTGECVCPPGKAFHNENCVETNAVSTHARLDANFLKELEDETSDEFEKLEEDLCKSFEITLNTRNTNVKRGFIKCFVRSFRNGSTIADMVTEYDHGEMVKPVEVDEVILAQLQEQDSNGEGYTLPDLSVSFTKANPVASGETNVTISDCDDGTDVCHPIYGLCKYTDGMTSYTCTCADDSEDQYDEYDIGVSGVSCRSKPPNYALLIGLCVGVPLALILIVMVVMVICLKTSAKKGAGGIEGDDTDQGDNHGKPEDFAGTMANGLADEGYDEGEVEKLEAMAAAISNMGTEPAMPLPRASQTETSFMAPNGHAAPPHGAHVNYGYNPTSPRTSFVLEGATPNSYEMNNRQPTQTQQHWVYRGSVAEA